MKTQPDTPAPMESVVSFPEYYFTRDASLAEQWDVWLYLFCGSLLCFLYVALNKYSIYYFQKEEVSPSQLSTKPKFFGIRYIWYSRFKSLIFRICFFYGLTAGFLFLVPFLLDVNAIIDLHIPQSVALHTKIGIIDFLWAGFIFATFCYPLLTSKFIGNFGIDWIEKLFANPTDTAINNDINNSRRDFVRHKIKKLNKIVSKKLKSSYGNDHFKYQILSWNQLNQTPNIPPSELEEAIESASEKYPDDVINMIVSVMKIIGDPHVEAALNYRIWSHLTTE